jgi:D-alanyl-D-alanine carboxypeptidase
MKIRFLFSVLLLPIILFTGCGEKKETDSKQTDPLSTKQEGGQFPDETLAKIDSVLNQAMLEDSIPGIMGGIWIKGKGSTIFKKGVADLSDQRERHIKDHIRVGSITKTFTATVFLQLCDEGKVALNDRLDKYFPQVTNAKDIDMRMLMNMTSGLQDYLNVPELDDAFFYNRMKKYTDEQILELAMTLPPMFPPGEPGKYHYSNTNYLLLGMIIDKVTGNKWQDEVTERIINRLGLKETLVPDSPLMRAPFCNGYMKDSTGKVINVTAIGPSITGAAGNMVSTIEDLNAYARALVDGTMLSDSMQAERLKTVPIVTRNFLHYGLGIAVVGKFYGHNGGITGFNTSMYYSPELDAMFVLNVNMFGPTGGVSDKIFISLSEVIYPGEMPWEKK